MIILRNNKYSDSELGKFKDLSREEKKNVLKYAAKGGKCGLVLTSPLSLLALKKEKYKTAAGIAGIGAAIGGNIGANVGKMHNFAVKNSPEIAERLKMIEECKKRHQTVTHKSKNSR